MVDPMTRPPPAVSGSATFTIVHVVVTIAFFIVSEGQKRPPETAPKPCAITPDRNHRNHSETIAKLRRNYSETIRLPMTETTETESFRIRVSVSVGCLSSLVTPEAALGGGP